MQIRNTLFAATALAAALAAAPAAQAAAPGWYLGAGVGGTKLQGGATAIDPNIGTEGAVISLDDKSTGWKVFGGYRFNQNFAAEAIYAKLGKFSVTHAQVEVGNATDRAKPDALCLAGVGTLPLGGKWSLLGKAGVCHWNDHPSETEATRDVYMEESSGTDPMFGVGASYDLTKKVSLRGEWERYHNVVHNSGDVDLLSVSLNYLF